MKFLSLSRYAFALVCACLLASCGGGGATPIVVDIGPIAISPATGTWYAGIVNTLTVTGATPPYQLSSSEPGILPLPATLNGHSIDLVPGNPGVVDAGLAPGELQVRTVIITARSAEGQTATATIKIAQNFLTGYGMSFFSTTCATVSPCAGGETTIIFDSTFNGGLFPNRIYRIERVRGPFQFVDPLNTNNQTDVVNVVSDHEGKFTAVIRVAAGTPTQIGIIRITDTATGASTLRTFTISGTPATGLLTVIPAATTLTGPNANICGFGTFDVLVFDGQTPYTAACPNPQIQIATPTSNTQPGRFTLNVGASSICLTGEQCVVTDVTGARAIFTVTTIKGTAPTPPPAMTVSPNAITLACNTSGAVTVVGGSGSYSANSSHPRVTASVSGNTVTITRLGVDAGVQYPTTATVSVTDGTSIQPVTVTLTQASCP